MPQQRLPQGGFVGNQPFTRRGFRRAHHGVGFFAAIVIAHPHLTADAHLVGRGVGHHAGVGKQVFQFLDAAFHEGLFVFSGFVFGVFDEFSPFGQGFVQPLGHFLAPYRAQVLQFLFQFLVAFGCEVSCAHSPFLWL